MSLNVWLLLCEFFYAEKKGKILFIVMNTDMESNILSMDDYRDFVFDNVFISPLILSAVPFMLFNHDCNNEFNGKPFSFSTVSIFSNYTRSHYHYHKLCWVFLTSVSRT